MINWVPKLRGYSEPTFSFVPPEVAVSPSRLQQVSSSSPQRPQQGVPQRGRLAAEQTETMVGIVGAH